MDRSRPQEPEGRRLVRSRQRKKRSGNPTGGKGRPLAQYDYALLPTGLLLLHRRRPRHQADDKLHEIPRNRPRRQIPRRLLAQNERRRPPLQRLLALQPHRRQIPARPRQKGPPPYRRMGKGRNRLAQREYVPGLRRACNILHAVKRPQPPQRRRPKLAKDPRYVRPVPRRYVRRRRKLPPRLHGPPPGGRDMRNGRDDALARNPPHNYRRPEMGRQMRGRDIQLTARRLHPRYEGPALSDRPEYGALRPQQQIA